jgi:hypothetical protein
MCLSIVANEMILKRQVAASEGRFILLCQPFFSDTNITFEEINILFTFLFYLILSSLHILSVKSFFINI